MGCELDIEDQIYIVKRNFSMFSSLSSQKEWEECWEEGINVAGRASVMQLEACVKAWFFGLRDLYRPILENLLPHLLKAADMPPTAEEWERMTEAGRKKINIYNTWVVNRAAVLALWMLGDLKRIPHYARRAMGWFWQNMNVNYIGLGRPAKPSEVRAGFGDYLLDCIAAGEYAEGVRAYERLTEPVKGRKPRMPALATVAYRICRERLAGREGRLDEKLLRDGEKALARQLFDPLLNSGFEVEAGRWIKGVYWDTGWLETPEACFERGFRILQLTEQAQKMTGKPCDKMGWTKVLLKLIQGGLS